MANFTFSSIYNAAQTANAGEYTLSGGGSVSYGFTDNQSDTLFEIGDIIDLPSEHGSSNYVGAYENGIIYDYYGSYYYFSSTPFDPGLNGQTVTASPQAFDTTTGRIVCFLRGTRLLMADGSQKAVEDIAAGDLVATADGGPEPVLFAGCTKHFPRYGRFAPEELPIRIRAGALGDNLPSRDLLISGGHGIAFGEVIVPAKTLVNGRSITVDSDARAIEFWHIRLPRHALVVSEGVASESFKHTPKFRFLAQASAYAAQFPDDVSLTAPECELRYPDVLPRVRRGRKANAVKAWIDARAGSLGYPAGEAVAAAA